jgi:aminomethyltransferase
VESQINSKPTPLLAEHQKLNARLIEYAGWLLPVQYAGIAAEHQAVRSSVGVFDVSHMGEILVSGPDAAVFLDYLLTRDMRSVQQGRAYYSPMCDMNGGTVDDLLVYPLRPDQMLLVVNAANTEKDLDHIRQALATWMAGAAQAGKAVQVADLSSDFAQIALQGPSAASLVASLEKSPEWQDLGLPEPAAATGLKSYRYIWREGAGGKIHGGCLVSRTGYTGEDGFEIYIAPQKAAALWQLLISRGAIPAGLGARDSLRLEAAMPLYGHELSPEITPLEAGLSRFVSMDKPDPGFVGQPALKRSISPDMADRPPRRLIGLQSLGKAIPRADYPVLLDGRPVGKVTSGTFSPTLNLGIAMALVNDLPLPGQGKWQILIRGKEEPFEYRQLPFYKR